MSSLEIAGEDDETWALLLANKVVVPESLKKILRDLEFNGIRALTRVYESSRQIEEYIRDVLGHEDVLAILIDEEKEQIFGPIFSRCPKKFKLSPGHKATFQTLSEVCRDILEAWRMSGYVGQTRLSDLGKSPPPFFFGKPLQ